MTGHDEAQDLERQILVRALGDLGADAAAFGGRARCRDPHRRGASRAVVRAAAKEGLIRQLGGQKAAARVRDALLRSSLARPD